VTRYTKSILLKIYRIMSCLLWSLYTDPGPRFETQDIRNFFNSVAIRESIAIEV
jgi:hypothetical protein